ncbi:MAG: DUF2510 domain-containing protein [Acidimicrobiales bacterium]
MSSSPAANWYPDPANPALLRYWDGARWTDHTHDPNPQAVPAAATAEPALPPAPVALTQPASGPAQSTTVAEPPGQTRGGLFGSKKALETELEELRGFVAGFGYAERDALRQRREFFYAAPSEVKALLTAADGSVLEFIEEPEADEWHQSLNARRRMRAAAANQA